MLRRKNFRRRLKCSNRAPRMRVDPISKQHYKEMAAHYRSLAAEHLDVKRDEPAN